ncbi:unnamed protein product [Moritella viscosa]|nr:unnamed protein product [Moritella viscosa]
MRSSHSPAFASLPSNSASLTSNSKRCSSLALASSARAFSSDF